MKYRRSNIPGTTYFFTLNLQNRKTALLIDHIDQLRFAFKKVQANHPFQVDAIVILPEHFHLMMTLPLDDAGFSKRLSLIKSSFSRQIISSEAISSSRMKKRERGIWQRRFWEHWIRDEVDYEHHLNYIHYNPVKHGLVSNPTEWPYSSIHRFIKLNLLPSNWASNNQFQEQVFGE